MVSMPKINFGTSAEKDAMIAAGGAVFASALIPFTPQLPLGSWSKVSNLIYGAALIVIGMHIKADGVGYFLIGAGVVYAIDGLVRCIFPALATVSAPAFSQIKTPTKSVYSSMATVTI